MIKRNALFLKSCYCTFRKIKNALLSGIIFFVALSITNEAKAQTQKPNIILILADDIGYKSLRCNGGNLYSTPNLDTLAEKGMRFTQCHASPMCSPSRFLLLTGKYNFRNYTSWGVMDTGQRTIANMFSNAGYTTACFGKWQLDGGDASIKNFGFQHYCIWDAYTKDNKSARYKNPVLYANGNYVSPASVLNKYGDDIFTDSIMNFIDENKANPFFIYYPMVLGHHPCQPTPDDSDFANWNSATINDTSYYPSEMKYMDKKIGEILNKVKEAGIENNTVIIYLGDNGTPSGIAEYLDEDDGLVTGGKSSTNENGLHVPMIVYWPETVMQGTVNNNLIGFTDFFPSLAGIADIPVPDYGQLDGVSFASQLTGNADTVRQWLFYDYNPEKGIDTLKRWAQNIQYKLYDTSAANSDRLFYDIINDPEENHPIPDDELTPEQISIKQQLLDIINGYIAQGIPILDTAGVSSVSDSSALIRNSIEINGGSTITASGVVWGTHPGVSVSSDSHTSENIPGGKFTSLITGLMPNSTYYAKTYATNIAGTAYSKEITFTTPDIPTVATNATEINNTSFVAHWLTADTASNYKLDVSTEDSFAVVHPDTVIQENFDSGILLPRDWSMTGTNITTDSIKFGEQAPSLQFKQSNQKITTRSFTGAVSKISFWMKGLTDSAGILEVDGFDGTYWQPIDTIKNISKPAIIKTYDTISTPALKQNFRRFRFIYTRINGSLDLDDINITYSAIMPSFVHGYFDSTVTDNFLEIAGLKKNTQYFYRVRTVNANGISGNSNTISVYTSNIKLDTPVCTSATKISRKGFTANWNFVENADTYKIDVSTSPVFSQSTTIKAIEPFNNGLALSPNWIITRGLTIDTVNFGKASSSVKFSKSGQSITTNLYPSPVTSLSFYVRGFRSNPGSLIVEGFDGSTWQIIDNFVIPKTRTTKTYDSASLPVLENKFIRFRFTFTKAAGIMDLDDISVKYTEVSPLFVANYIDSSVTNNFLKIEGLKNNTKYYYRVRAFSKDLDDTSAYSNVMEVITCDDSSFKQSEIISQSKTNKKELITIFPNPSTNQFNLSIRSGNQMPVHIIVTSGQGNKVYEYSGMNKNNYFFGSSFIAGIYFAEIIQGDNKETIKLIKAGK
ncbi:MAG: sulfatase-like hydrolase/transferase [Parafilimonas sp.]|nr:sulfatase-like hydrolase/transferase [Parafilimonas sp.]